MNKIGIGIYKRLRGSYKDDLNFHIQYAPNGYRFLVNPYYEHWRHVGARDNERFLKRMINRYE